MSQQGPELPREARMCEVFDAEAARGRTPGLYCLVHGRYGQLFERAVGVADARQTQPIGPRTRFRIASITKTLTATAILQLIAQDAMRLDDPLTTHIPEFARVRSPLSPHTSVTIRRLLTHASGLAGESPALDWDALVFPNMAGILAALPQTQVVLPPDAGLKYSNLGYSLLGEVVARVAGMPYRDYLTQHILRPLGMHDTAFDPPSENAPGGVALGHHRSDAPGQFEVAPRVDLNGMAPCGGLWSTAADLLRWAEAQMPGAKPSVIPPAVIEAAHAVQHQEADGSVLYALAWRGFRYGERLFFGHGGGLHGYASMLLYSRATCDVAVALANTWPHPGLLPLTAGLLGAQPNLAPPHVAPLPDDATHAWTGEYQARPRLYVVVAFRRGRLGLEPSPRSEYSLHAPAVLEALGEGRFIVRSGRAIGESLQFTRDAKGRAEFSLAGWRFRRMD